MKRRTDTCRQSQSNVQQAISCDNRNRLKHYHYSSYQYWKSVKSINYICKYVSKGNDRTIFAITYANDEAISNGSLCKQQRGNLAHILICYPRKTHAVVHLALHLENEQRLFHQQGESTVDNINKLLFSLWNRYFCLHFSVCWNVMLIHMKRNIEIISVSKTRNTSYRTSKCILILYSGSYLFIKNKKTSCPRMFYIVCAV